MPTAEQWSLVLTGTFWIPDFLLSWQCERARRRSVSESLGTDETTEGKFCQFLKRHISDYLRIRTGGGNESLGNLSQSPNEKRRKSG